MSSVDRKIEFKYSNRIVLLRATRSHWCLIRPSSRERCFTADSCCQEKSPLIICWAVAIHICKSCRAPRNPELLGNVFHQHHVGLKITGNGTWELSDSGCYSLENITRVIFFTLWAWFYQIQHFPNAHFSFTAMSGINTETAADKVCCCKTPNTSVHPCSGGSLWGDSVISSSLTLACQQIPAWAEMKVTSYWANLGKKFQESRLGLF